MRAQEFVTDEINKQVFSPGWTDETTILNRYVLKARAADDWNKYQKLDIDVFDPEGEIPFRIAYARFRIKPGFFFQKNLEASMIYVSQEYQKRGIATAIYQYVRKLGNTIKPSRFQLPAGKSMWKSFDRTDALAEEFDGPTAAGCIVVAEDTGRWCLQQRSNTVSDPGVWSTWGGGREPGETLEQAVRRELEEEGGYVGPLALEPLHSNSQYATFIGRVPHEFEPRINQESKSWCWADQDQLPEPLHPGLVEALKKIPLAEDNFQNNFSQIDQIITKQYSKEILNLLLGMFPAAKEAIVNQYNDEDGMPFAEWRRAIYEIENYVLLGPVTVSGAKLPIEPELYADRLQKFQKYIQDKDAGKPAQYFRNSTTDPRAVDFTKLPPITLAQTDKGLQVTDGNHRAFLAKMANKPLKAFVWKKQKNNHPNVAKIKSLFQELSENFADGKVKGKSRPGRVKRAGASCNGSVTDLRRRAKAASGERARMYHWCANMKSGRNKNK